MMVKFINKFKRISVLVLSFCFCNLQSQTLEKNNSSKNLYNQYNKFGLVLGMSFLPTYNETNAINYHYPTQKSYEIGLEYNFYQIKNYYFKASLLWRTYRMRQTQYFKNEDTGYPFQVPYGTYIDGPYNQFKIPIVVEYNINLNKNFSIALNVGPEVLIYAEDPSSGIGYYFDENLDEVIGYRETGKSKNGSLFFGINSGLSINLKTKPFLIKPYFTYHYQPEAIYTNVVKTENLLVSENTVSTHKIKGNYFLFGITIHPSKTLFKSKK